jgi:hypothetical protein
MSTGCGIVDAFGLLPVFVDGAPWATVQPKAQPKARHKAQPKAQPKA